MRSHLRVATVIGAATLSVIAVAPAMAAAPVAQSGANALLLSVAGSSNGTGDVTATNDGSSERRTGNATPPVSVLKGQQVFNGGVLAQEARAAADSTSAACAGLAGKDGSVAQIGDSSCLNPGDPVDATLGSLDLSGLVVADPDSALKDVNGLTEPIVSRVTPYINQATEQARAQFGDMGLKAGFGVVEGRCTASLGSATGDATLANAKITVQVPGQDGQAGETVTLLDLRATPKPNTHLTTNLSEVLTMVLAAVRADLNESLDGQAEGLTEVSDAIQEQIVDGVVKQVEGNLAPLEQNLVDVTLNRQIRPTDDSIKVRALDLEVLPALEEQLDAALVSLQIGNAACGPSGRVAADETPAVPSGLPTAVSAGYATVPGDHARQGDDNTNTIVLGAVALLVSFGAGFVTFRRLRA